MAKKANPDKKTIEDYKLWAEENPDHKIQQAVDAMKVSAPTISNWRKELGITKTRDGSPKSQKQQDQALKDAIELAGGYEKLKEILDKVDRAGGIEEISSKLAEFEKLKQIFG